jgi:predicted metalloprotease with PDZ domain
LSPELRKERQLGEDIKGVLVTGVTAGSPAQAKGIAVGEVIAETGGRQVRAPKDVAAQVAAKRGTADSIVLVVVNAKGERREVTVPLGAAGGETVYATTRHEAMRRLRHFAFDAAVIDKGDNKDLVNELMRLTVPIYLDDGETEAIAVVAGIRTLLSSTR